MTAEDILDTLTKQRFRDFYENDFDDWLTGEEGRPSREDILDRINKLFKIS